MAQQTTAETDAESLQNTIASLVNDLLDAHYDAYPSSNAFGADYDAPGDQRGGTYYVGREHGADGADSEVGFDYLYRRFPDPDEPRQDDTAYVYGNYGWMDVAELIDEAQFLRALFEEGADAGYLTDADLERFDTTVDAARSGLRTTRDQYGLEDLAALFRDHDIDTLRTLLAHGDEEGRVVWQLLFSKDEDGNHIENPIEVPVLSESDQFMLVRTDRYYFDDQSGEGKHYNYAAVIGYDDTPQRFFVHRLDGSDLGGDEPWTPARVKNAMGFDYNLAEVDTKDLPYGERVRVQGDLTVVRHDYDVALEDYRKDVLDAEHASLLREYSEPFLAANPDVEAIENDRLWISSYGRIDVRADSTDDLKALQDELGLDEETVRARQDDRGWSRLTAGRRADIVQALVADRIRQWAAEHEDVDLRGIKRDARQEAREAFQDTDEQSNAVLGNHTVLLSDVAEHPDLRFGSNGAQGAFVVPKCAKGLVIHDEHEDKALELGRGVYEFRFLNGHSDEWWQENA